MNQFLLSIERSKHNEEAQKVENNLVFISAVDQNPFLPFENTSVVVTPALEPWHLTKGISVLLITPEGDLIERILPIPDARQPNHEKVLHDEHASKNDDCDLPLDIEPLELISILLTLVELVDLSGEVHCYQELD